MFEIAQDKAGILVFTGRLDAAQCATAQAFIDKSPDPSTFDFAALEYISSAGLGVLLKTHKRLMANGGRLRLLNVNNHIFDVFRYSGFDQLFEVRRSEP